VRVSTSPARYCDLDQVDRKIIVLLQEDGRRPAAEIARIVGISVQTVTNRIGRLVGNAVVDVMAVLNPVSIGLEKDAIICMRVNQGSLRSVAERLAELEFVSYVGYVTGSFNLMIEVYVRDDGDLLRFIADELSQITEIRDTEVWTVLEVRKDSHAWSTLSTTFDGDPDPQLAYSE
jgi:Lrp/AsnC family transcriptional regulator for asnA, asnC and gidA